MNNKNHYRLISLLLAFIFSGVIIGETVALSLAVSTIGSDIISRFYVINGLLLLGLPILFFSYIDRVNRGKLLSIQLLVISILLFLLFIITSIASSYNLPSVSILIHFLYPFSYLSKTVLFLTFWTLANDVYSTSEAKKTFPVIAAWGFIGGLSGACTARVLVEIVSAEMVIALWALLYFVAWIFAKKVCVRYNEKLLRSEETPNQNTMKLFGTARNVMAMPLVRLMAVFYFLVFIAIFSLDYVFWNRCNEWFATPHALTSFQFTFYLAHSIISIAGLSLLVPPLIARLGFSRLFFVLPVVLFVGAFVLLLFQSSASGAYAFSLFVSVQFLRHIAFENAFSPIYQMFFAAIEKQRRGRAKTILEGLIKPAAIVISGVLLLLVHHSTIAVLVLITICGILLIITVYRIRKSYSSTLISDKIAASTSDDIFAEIISAEDLKILALLKEYSRSNRTDLRLLAVRLLAGIGSRQAFDIIVEIYQKEDRAIVKETIARSLTPFVWQNSKPFFEELLKEQDIRIRANTIYSLNEMNPNWKRQLKPLIKNMLFENSLRVQIEAARFLWNSNEEHERENVLAFLNNLLRNANTNKRSAGLYLIGLLRPHNWEQILIENLTSTSFTSLQVFTKSIEVIMEMAGKSVQKQALQTVETLSRAHIAITGRAVEKCGVAVLGTILEFLPQTENRRMLFEMIRCLRKLADTVRSSGKPWSIDKQTEELIQNWIMKELEMIYRDGFVRYNLWPYQLQKSMHILDNALRENMIRVCEWAVNAMVLLDTKGILVWRHTDIDIREKAQRLDLIEIIESGGGIGKVGNLILPLLRDETWDRIARRGRQYFRFSDETVTISPIHFIKSENNWIRFCALYYLVYYQHALSTEYFDSGLLMNLMRDTYNYMAEAAKSLFNKEDQKKIRAFRLLDTVLFFKKTALFRQVPAEKLMQLAEISYLNRYEKGTIISEQGEMSDNLYIVKSGALSITKESEDIVTELGVIGKGEAYGEIGLLTREPRSATAMANETSELYVIQRGPFKKLLMEIPEISYNLLEVFSEKLRKNGEEIATLNRLLIEREQTTTGLIGV